MKPTLGRIVHYNLRGQMLAAMVCRVQDDGSVNLQVFEGGTNGSRLVTEVREGTVSGTWHWPPRE